MKLLGLLMLSALFVACEQQGPLEEAAEKIDNVVEEATNAADTLTDTLHDAADEVRTDVEDATEALN